MWALSCKGTDIFLLTAEDDFSSILGYWLLALYYKGSENFFTLPNQSLVEDDFSSILGYRRGPYGVKALGFYIWLLKTISVRYLDIDCWPYITKAVRFSLFCRTGHGLKTISVRYSDIDCWPYITKAAIMYLLCRTSLWLKTISVRYLDIDVGLKL